MFSLKDNDETLITGRDELKQRLETRCYWSLFLVELTYCTQLWNTGSNEDEP